MSDRTDWLLCFHSCQTFRHCNTSVISLVLTHKDSAHGYSVKTYTGVCVHMTGELSRVCQFYCSLSMQKLIRDYFRFLMFSVEPTVTSRGALVERTHTASLSCPVRPCQVKVPDVIFQHRTETNHTHGFIILRFKNTLNILESSAALFLEGKKANAESGKSHLFPVLL